MKTAETTWTRTTLGVACQINPPKPRLADCSDDTPVLFVPMAAVDDVSGRVMAPERRILGEVRSKSYRTFTSKDVLFAKITPCMENGKSAIVPGIDTGLGFGSTEFHVLRPGPDVAPGFIWHFVRQHSFRRTAEKHMTGSVGQLRVPADFLREFRVDLPPKHIQEQIVGVLDAATTSSRSSRDHIASARRALLRFRQAVLSAAFREASTWDERNTEVPLASILREPLKNGYSARPVNHETPFRVLTLTATTSGWFDGRHFKYTDEEFPPESPFWLTPGDIVIQRGNTAEYVGVPAFYDGDPGEYLYPDLMIRARVLPEIDPRFAWYMLLAPQARSYLRDRATGSAGNMPKINQKVLMNLPIPVPPVHVRRQIVAKLDKALALARDVSNRIEMASRSADLSSQAVLAKAFRGELVPPKARAE
ncbi:type I restriction enzyme S subunit [Kribbella sp. VKM Ac-2527]|uniref:Type I restriction enzyme S subunit n=1 Tax=Kribbella caucasensis TaxID=2512215 RepID=A0A4R6J2I5_9ACTN|nr:restriction endonuclease subunit S [Kribbella sp. VKM Ac-2527]TDO29484.1 type I restriction enzyme S subunit [Kribbella sp. VKM Ac-2527]